METTVTNEVVDLDKLFPGIDTEQVLTSKVPSVLSNEADLDSFRDMKPEKEEVATEEEQQEPKEETGAPKIKRNLDQADTILDEINKELITTEEDEDTEKEKGNAGRPKIEKNALTNYLKDKIEAGTFSAFEDWDEKEPLEQYLSKQPEKILYQMLDANLEAREREMQERLPIDFMQSLSPELQYAAKYELTGGRDVKQVFAALSRIVENRELDPATEEGQTAIARTYLQTIDFGTQDAIEDEIANWKETNRLEKKAIEFKPKLDQMEKEQLEFQLAKQEEWNRQQAAAAQAYMQNVQNTIKKGELGGVKVDKKLQAALYNGLTSVSFPTTSGRPSNLFGHLLDKIQYAEPNFDLIAEVTWHMMDPEGYRNAIRQQGANTTVKETVKQLKSQMVTNTGGYEAEDYEDTPVKKKLPKPKSILEVWK